MSTQCLECQRLKDQIRILQVNNEALKLALDSKNELIKTMLKERENMRRKVYA